MQSGKIDALAEHDRTADLVKGSSEVLAADHFSDDGGDLAFCEVEHRGQSVEEDRFICLSVSIFAWSWY